MKGLKENPWKKIQFISTNCNLHENMIANKFFYIKRERKKKKLILKCIWPILSKNSYKLKHECFFSTLEGRFLKLQFVTPKLASFQNFQSSTGTKTRLVLGSGQPRQRVMKTFPSFFFLFFFFAPKRQLQTIQLRATRGRVVSRQKRRVVIPLFLFEAAPRVQSLFKRVSIGPTTTMRPLCIDLQCWLATRTP